MSLYKQRTHWLALLALLALLAGLWGPGLPAAPAGANPPPPPPEDAPAAPASPEVVVPSACLSHLSGGVNNADQPIQDNSTITSSLTISTSFAYIWSLRVITIISHTSNSQLDLNLISPAGTRVLLADKKGGANTNVFHGTSWHDDADAPVTDFTFSNNVVATNLSPQEPLGALRGENANGEWQLVIHDGFNGNVGVLEGWSVQVNGLTRAPDVVSTTTVGGGGFPIPDVGLAVAPLIMPSLPDPISAITLSTVITHNQPGSLQVFLNTSSGLTVTLSTGNGSSAINAFAGTLWDDRAARTDPLAIVTTHHYTSGQLASPLAPEEPLSLLLGKNVTGTWLLKVSDGSSDGKAGVLGPVVLYVETSHCFPNLSGTLISEPLFPRRSQPAHLIFGAKNTAVTATVATLTANLDPQFHYQALQSGSWSCSTPGPTAAGGDIHCTLASLGANQTEPITATVTAPDVVGQTQYTVTVSSSLPDTDPSDNTLSKTFFTFAHSANQNQWDPYTDTGKIDDAGQDTFDGWGGLRVVVLAGSSQLSDTSDLDFELVPGGPEQRWNTTTPPTLAGVQIVRQMLAPTDQNWMRYVDTFHNTTGATRDLLVAWGGDLGSDQNTQVQASSSGDLVIAAEDTWAVTQQGVPPAPAGDAPVGYAFRSPDDASYQGPVTFSGTLITETYPVSQSDTLAHLFRFTLAPGQTRRLAYFVYRGLSESNQPQPTDCNFYGGCVLPAPGTQVALADSTMAALVLKPALCDLIPAERDSLINWPSLAGVCGDLFLPLVAR